MKVISVNFISTILVFIIVRALQTNLERELTSTNGALEVHKTKVTELTQQNTEMKQKIASSDNRFTEVS